MLRRRIIPCLDVSDGRVVKGVNFVNLRDCGEPVEAALRYAEQGADEIVWLNITATGEDPSALCRAVERAAEQIDIPLTVGGGITRVGRVRELLLAGADKVSLNTGALARPSLIGEAADRFGSQCIVCAIDARREPDGGWRAYVDGGRKPSTSWPGARSPWSSAPASCWSPRWTPTACRTAMTSSWWRRCARP
jgi:cyclase